jgi:hypothetical protein
MSFAKGSNSKKCVIILKILFLTVTKRANNIIIMVGNRSAVLRLQVQFSSFYLWLKAQVYKCCFTRKNGSQRWAGFLCFFCVDIKEHVLRG